LARKIRAVTEEATAQRQMLDNLKNESA